MSQMLKRQLSARLDEPKPMTEEEFLAWMVKAFYTKPEPEPPSELALELAEGWRIFADSLKAGNDALEKAIQAINEWKGHANEPDATPTTTAHS